MHHSAQAIAALSLLTAAASSASAAIAYSNDFETPVGSEWSSTATDVTPAGARRFLGQFNNDLVTLSLNGLPAHDTVTISFDLFILQSWDGNSQNNGPDRWGCGYADNILGIGGTPLLDTSFSNTEEAGQTQDFPNAFGAGFNNPGGTGSSEFNTLGYTYFGDAVYSLTFTFPHSAADIYFGFLATGLQGINDESWGLDNVRVETRGVPAPTTITALALAGLASLRRRR